LNYLSRTFRPGYRSYPGPFLFSFHLLKIHVTDALPFFQAVECLLPDQQASLVRELDGHVLRCVRDANGNHVVQKMLERVIGERMTFVRAFSGSVLDLSTHPYGCRVLQRCFEYASAEQCRPLLDELRGYYTTLAKDQFGVSLGSGSQSRPCTDDHAPGHPIRITSCSLCLRMAPKMTATILLVL